LNPIPEPLVADPGASLSVVRRTRRGLLLMLAATAAFVAMSMCVKLLREAGLSTAEVIFFRTGPGLLWLWWTLRAHRQSLRPHRRDLVYLRSALGIGAMATSFYAVQSLTLVQHNVLSLLQPVFIALLAPLLLGEALRAVVAAALALAAGGAFLVIAPGADLGVVPLVPAVFGVASALLSAGAHMAIRRSMATESPEVVVFHFAVHATLFGMLWGISDGDFLARVVVHVSGETLLPLLALALFGVLGQLAMTRAYGHAPASQVAIVAYAGIPMSLLGDLVLWGAQPALSSAFGAILMAAAGYLLTRPRP
jgi:drug/metabolite transporter (DMT)-like permease